MVSKICTSIEQSKKLLDLGLDPYTADMFWSYHDKWYSEGDEWEGYEDFPRAEPYFEYTRNDREWEKPKQDIPAWSLSALIELMPAIAYNYPVLARYAGLNPGEPKYFMQYVDLNVSGESKMYKTEFYPTPLDAAYNMMIWLIENNYIKL